MDVRWNSTYLMLQHLVPYRSTFSVFIATRYQVPAGAQQLLIDDHWYVGEKILEFFELFYDSTVAIFGVYYPTAPLMLDPRAKIKGFNKLLQLLSGYVGIDYSSFYINARLKLTAMFNKYETKFGAVRLQRPSA
uniref:hAT-like transposase RNase-H fold domain-containing protein n=1 Tax=Arundo donax TaxID=35708 RepID=A0A0A8YWF6_ARUDO